MSKQLWEATPDVRRNSQISQFIDWLTSEKQLAFETYHDLWSWSTNHIDDFWAFCYEYFDIIDHGQPHYITSGDKMPFTKWFDGSKLNYVEHIFRNVDKNKTALLSKSEIRPLKKTTWSELIEKVSSFQSFLISQNIKSGDRIVSFMPNIEENTIAFLASAALGCIWSSTSPDFGADSVLDRFAQIEPVVFLACDGYTYNGKNYDKREVVVKISSALPTLKSVVIVPYLGLDKIDQEKFTTWEETLVQSGELIINVVKFDHPLWVLYSSGTTGQPKAITHSHGGVLLEHMKYMLFHNDVHPGENFYWYSTTGWMMWNFLHASWLVGATPVLYEGSASYPSLNHLWEFIDEAQIHHFGTSAPFIIACMKRGIQPKEVANLNTLRSLGSTGAPLPPEGFDYCYENIKQDLWLCSMSGGTDVCTAFVGGCILEPVYEGEIQVRGLGCALFSFDDDGNPIMNEVGEMVITKPMPSMPIYFWNDKNKERYHASYFDVYQDIWRHGDWVKITPHHSLVILGRSDATLNRHGIRIGTAEIYSALHDLDFLEDSLIINIEKPNGDHYMPLFVKLKDDLPLQPEHKKKIRTVLREKYSPRHVPDEIVECPAIPYTISGKKLETPIKKILLGRDPEKSANRGAMKNPECLDFFVKFYDEELASGK